MNGNKSILDSNLVIFISKGKIDLKKLRSNNSKNGCLTKDAEKDALKAASKAKTKESEVANLSAYKTGSTRLDAVIGVLGKDTPEGKQAARLRSSLNSKSKPRTNNQNNSLGSVDIRKF
jgi:hypothetical protein